MCYSLKTHPNSEIPNPRKLLIACLETKHILWWLKIMYSLGVEGVNSSPCTDYSLTELFCIFVTLKILTK